jgi:exosortase/archaeosortase family protein
MYLHFIYLIIINLIEPDPFTKFSAYFFDSIFQSITTKVKADVNGFIVFFKQKAVVNLAEGCNGMAIWITLISFCLAFGGSYFSFIWFFPASYLILQVGNIFRLWVLVQIKVNFSSYFSLFHEYLVPALLYGFAFLIMVFWVKLQKHALLHKK